MAIYDFIVKFKAYKRCITKEGYEKPVKYKMEVNIINKGTKQWPKCKDNATIYVMLL